MKTAQQEAASLADYKEFFESPVGKRIMFDLMKAHGVLNSSFIPGDSHSTSFNEGARSVVLRILKRSKRNIKQFLESVDEMNRNQEGEF